MKGRFLVSVPTGKQLLDDFKSNASRSTDYTPLVHRMASDKLIVFDGSDGGDVRL
jgi:hypothetical protein